MSTNTTGTVAPSPARPDPGERPRPQQRRWLWLGAAALVVVTLAGANHRLVRGTASGIWDADSVFAPYYMLVADHARSGRIMLWNPWVSAGSPDGFEPQLGAQSPLTVGMGLLTGGHEWGFRLYWLTLWALGGLGMLLLARHLGAPAWAGCIGAIAFMFSGPYTGHAQHTSWIESISFLPWVLWRLDVAVTRRKLLPAAQAGALWGLSALAGYPALTMITAGFGGMWVLGRTAFGPEAGRGRPGSPDRPDKGSYTVRGGKALGILAVFAVGGVAILSPTFVGFMIESKGYSQRAGALPRERAIGSNALHPGALMTHASPAVAVGNQSSHFWPYTDVSMCSVYVAPVVVALAGLALSIGGRGRFRWWLLALGLLALAAAMGRALPVRGWLYDLLPPTRYFRHAAGFRIYWVFALVVLAMMGAADLAALGAAEARKAWRRLAAISAVGGVLALTALLLLLRRASPMNATPELAIGHLLVAWGLTPLAAWVGSRRPVRLVAALLIALVAADALLTTELSVSTMYLDRDKRWRAVEQGHVRSLDLTTAGLRRGERSPFPGHTNNKNLVAKQPVLISYAPISRNPLLKKSIAHPVLKRTAVSPDGTGRVWFCPDAPHVMPTEKSFDALAQRCTALDAPVVVVTDPANMIADPSTWLDTPANLDQAPAAKPQAAKVWRYGPDELGFDADCPAAGWLLVTDRWSRSWRVTVNGKDAKVWAGNFVFRAVQVETGRNRVHFTFRPPHRWLLTASWATLLLVGGVSAGAAAWGALRRRRDQTSG